MPYCAIAGCNTGNVRIPDANHFQCFNLPKSEDIKEKWLEKIKINRSDFAPSSHTVICEKHFRRYDFISDTQNLDRRGKTKKKKTKKTAPPKSKTIHKKLYPVSKKSKRKPSKSTTKVPIIGINKREMIKKSEELNRKTGI